MRFLAGCLSWVVVAACAYEPSGAVPVDVPPDGPDGPVVPGSVQVTSVVGFLARTVGVTLTGGVTGSMTLDAGPGVTVRELVVDGPGQAQATLAIAATAALGPRDLAVTIGGQRQVLAGALDIRPSLAATTRGPRAAGTTLQVDLRSLVPDQSIVGSPFQIGADLIALPESLVPNDTRTTVLIAPGAAAGPRAITWQGPGGAPVAFATEPTALTVIGARPPAVIGGPTGPLAPFETRTYTLRAGAGTTSIAVVSAVGVDEPSRPVFWLFAAAGRAADLIAYQAGAGGLGSLVAALEVPILEGEAPTLVTYAGDVSAGSGGVDLLLVHVPAVPIAKRAGHTTVESAQAVSACAEACVLTGTLTPGERHVLVIPGPRPGSTGPRSEPVFMLGLDAATAMTVAEPGLGGRRITSGGNRLRSPVMVSDASWNRDVELELSAPADGPPVSYRLAIRRTERTW